MPTSRITHDNKQHIKQHNKQHQNNKHSSERFTDELLSPDLKIFRYRRGPQPAELGGQRALDFVLDNATLQPFNRTLLFDIKLLAARPGR